MRYFRSNHSIVHINFGTAGLEEGNKKDKWFKTYTNYNNQQDKLDSVQQVSVTQLSLGPPYYLWKHNILNNMS
jgi:hypothetical protein